MTSPPPRIEAGLTKPILTLFISNLLGTLAGGIFFLYASWSFDLAEMGLYGVVISIQWVLAGLVGTALHVATIRLTTNYSFLGDLAASVGVVSAGVLVATGITLSTAALCYWLASISAGGLIIKMLPLVVLWAGARSVLDCQRAGLLVTQQYVRAGLLMVLSAMTGLIALTVVVASGPLTLKRLLMAHVLGLGTGAFAGLGLLLPMTRSGVNLSRTQVTELLRYARWPAMSEGTRLAQSHLGPFVLLVLAGSSQAGLFSLGRYPAYFLDVLAITLFQYWLPAAMRKAGQGLLFQFLRQHLQLAAYVGLGMILASVALRPLLPWLGSNLAAGSSLFILSTFDFALLLIIRPIESAYHGLHKPHLELLGRICRLPVLLGGAFLLASRFGALGMAWAQIISNLVGLGIAVLLLWQELESAR